MAASTSHLYFMVFLFCGGCLVLQPCEANHCTLDEVKECTKTLQTDLTHLAPVDYCPQTELTCLENLATCTDITNIINVFRYLCDDATGVADTAVYKPCLEDPVKAYNFSEAAKRCTMQSGWVDTLTGQQRCSAATSFTTCMRPVAESLCTGNAATRFFEKTVELIESYGCFKEADQCTLEEVKECTKTLQTDLTHLAPVNYCPQTELTCLENLETCTDITNIINVFRYLCDDATGVADTAAYKPCLEDPVKSYNFSEAAKRCTMQSGWVDTLTGQQRCSAATTFVSCMRPVAESLCTGDAATRFFENTVELIESYGCFKVERPTNQGGTIMPNKGMITVILGMTLVTLLFK